MYFPQLTFCRYIAAFIVLLTHFALISEVMALPGIGNILRYANSLLSFFFVLTGFILIISLNRNNQLPPAIPIKLLLLNRAIRLYPLHWLALALLLLAQQVIRMPDAGGASMGAGKLLAQVLLLQAWYPPFALVYNFVSWTLCVDILLALLAPWLYGWMLKQSTRVLVQRVALIWVGSVLVYQVCIYVGMPLDWGFFWPPFHVPEFIVGMGGGFLITRNLPMLNRRANWLHALAYLNGGLMIGVLGMGLPFMYKNSLLLAPSYLFILLSIAVSDNWITQLFSTKPLQYLGKISYGVYILQLPVAFLVLDHFHHWVGWPFRYSALLFIVLLTALAAVAYEWVEKPIVTYAKSRLSRQLPKPDVVGAGLPRRSDEHAQRG